MQPQVRYTVPRGWPAAAFPPGRRTRREFCRGSILRLGALLGCPDSEVKRLTEDLTGVPWARCGCREFTTVLHEYRAIADLILSKQRREARRIEAAQHGLRGRP